MTDEKQAAQGSGRYIWYFKRSKRVFSLQEIQCLRNLMREGIPERIRWSWHLAPADVALV